MSSQFEPQYLIDLERQQRPPFYVHPMDAIEPPPRRCPPWPTCARRIACAGHSWACRLRDTAGIPGCGWRMGGPRGWGARRCKELPMANNGCYLNPELCAKCGGKCCKNMPGCAFPADFTRDGDPQIALAQAFKSGNWVIDWWEGDPRGWEYEDNEDDAVGCGYYVRPRIVTEKDGLYHASWGGECIFLTPTGCDLKPTRRPQQCRMLEPAPGTHCIMHSPGSKHDAALAWLPYHDIIKAAVKEATDAQS